MKRVRQGCTGAILLLLLLGLCSGCGVKRWLTKRGQEEPVTQNPFPQVHSVAVVEFRDWSGQSLDGWQLADVFASELAQTGLFDVFPVAQVRATSVEKGMDVKDPKNAVAVARAIGADAVVLGGVTGFEYYPPKRLGLSVVILDTKRDLSAQGANLIMELERTGKALQAFTVPGAEGIVAYKARVFDASRNDVVKEAKIYAAMHKGREGPLGWQAYLEITEEFLRFSCNRLIRQILTEQPALKGTSGTGEG